MNRYHGSFLERVLIALAILAVAAIFGLAVHPLLWLIVIIAVIVFVI